MAVTKLQPRLGTVSSGLPHGCLKDNKGDTKGHFRDTFRVKARQLYFFQASDCWYRQRSWKHLLFPSLMTDSCGRGAQSLGPAGRVSSPEVAASSL